MRHFFTSRSTPTGTAGAARWLQCIWIALSTATADALRVTSAVYQAGGADSRNRRALLATGVSAALVAALPLVAGAADVPRFKRPPQGTQFIAALGDPDASSGEGATGWGLWREDPGPRGVWLRAYERLVKAGGKAPAGWTFEPGRWWLEEHGLIMEQPEPLPLSKYTREGDQLKLVSSTRNYLVTGGRELTAVLTVHADGRWELNKGKLYDVTHLPCRSALYTPLAAEGGACSPAQADASRFPVSPGGLMPSVKGCAKQDYAVLFVVGIEA